MNLRIGSVALAVCVVALPAASWAGQRGRIVEKPYQIATVGVGTISSTNGVEFRSKKGERFLQISIDDEVGTHVPARVGQDFDGDGVDERSDEICSETERPIKLRGGATVTVWLGKGFCGEVAGGRAGGWFQGVVTATFTR